MKLALFSILAFITAIPLFAQQNQLLINPDFDEGTNGWWYSGATVTTSNGETFFDISNAGTNPWDVQLGQGNFTLRQGYKYTLSWRAKREAGALEFRVALGSEPYTTYIYDKREDFNGNWQESSVEYIHNEADVQGTGVTLQMGGNDANATVDYIYLTEEPVTSEKIKVTFQVDMQNETVSGKGVFINGSFTNWQTPIKMQFDGTNYFAKLLLDKGTTVEYKYVNGDTYETLSGACATGDYNNRSFTVPESDYVIDAVCFNSCSSCTNSSSTDTNPGVGPVSYYGQMQASGNRIIGERTQLPMQVKGISFFWSLWGGENYWNPDAVDALVDGWKAELIRAPMSVEMDDQGSTVKSYLNPEGKQDQINLVETLVEAAIERDIYVIIDFHSHEAHLHTEEAKEFFGYMAEKYGSYDNVIFEIYNEPIDPDWPTIKTYAEAVIGTIREHSDNLVIVGTEAYSQLVDNASKSPIDDSNTAYVFHFYASHQEELRNIVQTALDNNVALFASEWGNIYVWGDKNGITDEQAFANSDAWHKLLDDNMISSANWSVFAKQKANAYSSFLHKLAEEDLSKTGENWNDTSIMTESGKYVFNMLKEHAKTAPWRKAEHTNTVNVTFRVDMQGKIISSQGIFLEGSFNDWAAPVKMTANASVYSATMELPVGEHVKYRFINGGAAEDGQNSDCFSWDEYRLLVVPESNIVTDAVCFNSCEPYNIDPSILETNPGVGPVSYYGEMQASGNRIIGERTQQPMQVKGISFFWSIWGGQTFWTPGAVNALVDDWKVELIRAPMAVDDDDEWSDAKGYLNPLGKQTQIENMERMVEAAIERDIYVIIDFHSHYAHLYTDQAKEFFGYMAEKYGSYDNVIFEIYNEPIDPDWPTIKAYAEAVIESIREFSDNLVIVGTEFYSQAVDNASLSPINDDNTAYVFHFYAVHQEELRSKVRTALDNNVALFASEWGNTYIGGGKDGIADAESFANSDAWHELMDENMISSANWSVFADGAPNSSNLHTLPMNELSKTGERWNDTTIMTPSGKYVYNMLKEHAKQAPWRQAEHTSTVEVTFNVNMYDETIAPEGVFLEGSFNDWESPVEMTADNKVYSATIELPVGDYIEYRFKNGTTLEAGENGDCYTWDKNRLVIVPETDVSLETPCFNSCAECVIIETFVIDAQTSPAAGGAVSGTGTYENGATVSLTATPGEGYEFINWTSNGEEISANEILTFSVTEDANLMANFELIPRVFYVDAVSSPANAGEIFGTGTFEEGTEATIIATPNEGYEFLNWTIDGEEVSADSIFTVNVAENLNLQANFKLVTGAGYLQSFDDNIQVFPNPAKNSIRIKGLAGTNMLLEIYNSQGRLILEKYSNGAPAKQIDLEKMTSGVYYLVIKGTSLLKTVKIIKIE